LLLLLLQWEILQQVERLLLQRRLTCHGVEQQQQRQVLCQKVSWQARVQLGYVGRCQYPAGHLQVQQPHQYQGQLLLM
jgi:hypothetical protein